MSHKHIRDVTDHARKCYVGICPACQKRVLWDDPGGPVWTCPADLVEENPQWEPPPEVITEEMKEKAGIYSNCGEDFGLPCYERLPLHSKCCDEGNY